jgi:ribA/ribD-fused uncharacterized protein
MPSKIDRFSGQFFGLSNFSPATVHLEGERYPTVEHAYQAAKTTVHEERRIIQFSPSPGMAKRHGQKATLRPDWEEIRLRVMEDLLRQKFMIPSYALLLLRHTKNAELIEGNTWGDRFWGQVDGEGENHLGKILMKLRAELENGQALC